MASGQSDIQYPVEDGLKYRTTLETSSWRAEMLEKAVRWSALGELGMERALRQCGAPEEVISRLIAELQPGQPPTAWKLSDIERNLDIPDAKCVFLAVLGRGDPLVQSLAVGEYQSNEERCQVNISLGDLNLEELSALCVNLAANEYLRVFLLLKAPIFYSDTGSSLLANALTANKSIRHVKDCVDQDFIMPGWFGCDVMTVNKSVQFVEFRRRLEGDRMKDVARLLESNTTLQTLDMCVGSFDSTALQYLSTSLKGNTGLVRFRCDFLADCYMSDMSELLAPFIHDGSAVPENRAITDLSFRFSKRTSITAAGLSAMIKTNKILKKLTISRLSSVTPNEWAEQFLPALQQNETLTDLTLDECGALGEGHVYNVLMEVVQSSNTKLEHISLQGTGLEAKEASVAEELRINKEYRQKLREQHMQKATTGRLVLCGFEFAGKTSISRTAARVKRGIQMSFSESVQFVQAKLLQNHPRVRELVFGKNAVFELPNRTRGIDIVRLHGTPMSLLDFAGQMEYYVLHDYLFPNSENSCFLYVCNARSPPTSESHGRREVMTKEAMKDQFLYWLRFIVSNTKPVQGTSRARTRFPCVMFVLTGKDTVDAAELHRCEEDAKDIVLEFQGTFQDVICLSQNVAVVSAHSDAEVKKLLLDAEGLLKHILNQSAEHIICADVRIQLEKWNERNPWIPMVSCDEFQQQIWENVRGYDTVEMHVVLAHLNDMGDVIFLKALDFVVVNPRWFGVGILGSLINAFAGTEHEASEPSVWKGLCRFCSSKPSEENAWQLRHDCGFVQRRRIDELLQKSLQSVTHVADSSDKLVDLLMHLEMCFQEQPSDQKSRLFIPALFDKASDHDARQGLRKLNWEPNSRHVMSEQFMGRRLECGNKMLTFLTPGYFPRLQVVLRNFLIKEGWSDGVGVGFRLASNLLGFIHDGMDVLVEYSGDIDYFVDILVKSSKSPEDTLQFINVIIQKIREFCASPQGCQGVELVEAVIRPYCVENLYMCADRKPHSVLVSKLIAGMSQHSPSYRYTWTKRIEGVPYDDFALDLLNGTDFYANFIAVNQFPQSAGSSTDWYRSRTSSLKRSDVPDLPTRFYPTIEDLGFMEKLDSILNLAKVMPIKLHLMCDGLDGDNCAHVVKDQPGRSLKLNEKLGGHDFPILKYAVKILWLGVKAGASRVYLSEVAKEIDPYVDQLSTSPVQQLSVDMLVKIMKHRSAWGESAAAHQKVRPEQILRYLEEYIRMDPYAQWLVDFLNVLDGSKFFADFQLSRVRNETTRKILWLCYDHHIEGKQKSKITSVPLLPL